MKQGLLGIEAEVEFGCDDDAMLGDLLNAGIAIFPLSDKKIRISANADQGGAVAAVLMERDVLKCSVYLNHNNSHGGVQKTCTFTLNNPANSINKNRDDVSLTINRQWGHYNHDTELLDSLVQKKGANYV